MSKKRLREQRRLSMKVHEEKAVLLKDLASTRKRISSYETAHTAMKRRCLRDKEYIANLEIEVFFFLRSRRRSAAIVNLPRPDLVMLTTTHRIHIYSLFAICINFNGCNFLGAIECTHLHLHACNFWAVTMFMSSLSSSYHGFTHIVSGQER